MIFLASSSIFSSGGVVGDLLSKWEEAGFFQYILPFLLIFALVFGILTKVNVFKDNKAVNGIIALAVALMSLQFSFVSDFFAQIFPRLGVGLAVILGVLILLGLFTDPESNWMNYVLLGIAAVVFIVVLIQSSGESGFNTGEWFQENLTWIIPSVLALILIIATVAGPSKKPAPAFMPVWARDK
jgi:hypothetical protein